MCRTMYLRTMHDTKLSIESAYFWMAILLISAYICGIHAVPPVDNFGTVVGESLDCLLLSGTVVGENPDHVCWALNYDYWINAYFVLAWNSMIIWLRQFSVKPLFLPYDNYPPDWGRFAPTNLNLFTKLNKMAILLMSAYICGIHAVPLIMTIESMLILHMFWPGIQW